MNHIEGIVRFVVAAAIGGGIVAGGLPFAWLLIFLAIYLWINIVFFGEGKDG